MGFWFLTLGFMYILSVRLKFWSFGFPPIALCSVWSNPGLDWISMQTILVIRLSFGPCSFWVVQMNLGSSFLVRFVSFLHIMQNLESLRLLTRSFGVFSFSLQCCLLCMHVIFKSIKSIWIESFCCKFRFSNTCSALDSEELSCGVVAFTLLMKFLLGYLICSWKLNEIYSIFFFPGDLEG